MFKSERLEAQVQQLINENVFPSASICVMQHGQIVYKKAFGLADPDAGLAATTETRYDLASLSKIFSASAFMTLVEEGRVSLDDPVRTVFPEFSGIREIHTNANWESPHPEADEYLGECCIDDVSFRQLLAHSSGLGGAHMYIRAAEDKDIVGHILRADFRYVPGTDMVYSDQDLILIGEAVACITGKPLDEAVQERVIEPLGLGQSGYARVSRGGLSGDVASTALCSWRGYRVKGVVHNEDSFMMDGVAGHTGIFATAEDVVKLVNNYLAAVHGTPGLVSVETAREMIRKQAADAQTGTNRRGLLWQLRTPDVNDATFPTGLKSFGHTGWTGTMVWADVERDMVFAILTNDIYLPQAERTLWSRRKSMVEYIIEAIDRG